MLAKLLNRRRSAVSRPALPAGQRVYAIGDVHGCLAELDQLLTMIDADDATRARAATTLIFIGDLVDRGPASAQVVERVIGLQASGRDVRVLAGNHEEVFAGALAGDDKALRMFCRIGGQATALSYGIAADAYERSNYDEIAALLARHVPAAHRLFLAALANTITIGDYTFVHAGVRPDLPLDEQRDEDLRWIRAPFLDYDRPLDRMIVHGHTIADEVERRPHRIGIDTGAYDSGRLSALGLEGEDVWHLQTSSGVGQSRPSDLR